MIFESGVSRDQRPRLVSSAFDWRLFSSMSLPDHFERVLGNVLFHEVGVLSRRSGRSALRFDSLRLRKVLTTSRLYDAPLMD